MSARADQPRARPPESARTDQPGAEGAPGRESPESPRTDQPRAAFASPGAAGFLRGGP